jgi:hypothetical protein
MQTLLLLFFAALSFSSLVRADSNFSYHMLQMGYQHSIFGVDELQQDLPSDGIQLLYTRELGQQFFIYSNINAGTLDTGLRLQNTRFNFTGTLLDSALGLGHYWVINDSTDIYLKTGFAHSRYDLTMHATDIDTNSSTTSKQSDFDTGLHLALGSRIFLNAARTLEFAPMIGLTSMRGDMDKHFGASLGLQTAPRIQLQAVFYQTQDNDLQSLTLAVRVKL